MILPLMFILGGTINCSVGTDKSAPLPEKSLSQLGKTEGSSFKSEYKALSEELADDHSRINESKLTPRKIVVPSEVEGKWNAVKILIRNKKDEEMGEIQILNLGASFTPAGSRLKVTVGPFLPNFMMDKTTYTSMGNEALNPAVQLTVEETGKIIYKGWAFRKFPLMYAFEHPVISIELLGAIPAVVS